MNKQEWLILLATIAFMALVVWLTTLATPLTCAPGDKQIKTWTSGGSVSYTCVPEGTGQWSKDP